MPLMVCQASNLKQSQMVFLPKIWMPSQDIPSLCDSTRETCLVPFLNVLTKLNDSTSSGLVQPITCIISDGCMSFSVKAAEELGIPIVLFWPTSPCGFLGIAHFQSVIDKGLVPLKDETDLTNGYLNTKVDWIPGMRSIQLRDLPSFIRTTDPNDLLLNFLIAEVENANKATAIILNTFEELDQDVVNVLALMFPPVYTIGPLHMLADQVSQRNLVSIGSNMWKEDTECLQWLESKKPRSVVYVNYGSSHSHDSRSTHGVCLGIGQ
ncbi:Glycosyltransferase [Quillaja saponaria]|uniref:Glycosyltransferase n=1 Tax=Quillaja saponaria TaxID=32244 RepID=A0AAD7PU18_QUISA|nr:Glycosyltransferase [Quillaja saponaria]